jgi:hypothetical protein
MCRIMAPDGTPLSTLKGQDYASGLTSTTRKTIAQTSCSCDVGERDSNVRFSSVADVTAHHRFGLLRARSGHSLS